MSLSSQLAQTGSATWKLNPTSGDWNTAANWTPTTVPNGPADTATFALSSMIALSLSANTEVNGIVFNPGANSFAITVNTSFTLTIRGTGITNNSLTMQDFVTPASRAGNRGLIAFTNSATAGVLTAFTNHGAVLGFAAGGETDFFRTSTAGNAIFTNDPGEVTTRSAGSRPSSTARPRVSALSPTTARRHPSLMGRNLVL